MGLNKGLIHYLNYLFLHNLHSLSELVKFNLLPHFQVVMKMETLSRDSLYLKQRLKLNIDVEFVRQGGKEGHTTADR